MSGRSGYSHDLDDLQIGRWRGQVASAIRGKRGQAFLRDLIEALDAMPEKRLIPDDLIKDGEVCALGCVGLKRGIDMTVLDPEEHDKLAAVFNIPHQLIAEIENLNDEGGGCYDENHKWGQSPEKRWMDVRAWAVKNLRDQTP